jgi:hypothetical protein
MATESRHLVQTNEYGSDDDENALRGVWDWICVAGVLVLAFLGDPLSWLPRKR